LQNLKERGYFEDLDTERKTILKWVLKKHGVSVLTGFMLLLTGTSTVHVKTVVTLLQECLLIG
jgi:hypothetical protein